MFRRLFVVLTFYCILIFRAHSHYFFTNYNSDHLVDINNVNDNNFHLKNKHLVTVILHKNSINSYPSTSL